ncbi:RNA polymerase sigma24 factor [Actinoplanes ianthinogenes]|uniref:RNA polymerase sigma24 factor n=1 Tax=Actinoplanes ianthinogenes TaxID=122358 RepID=A0ABM7LK50_9ACTN|nr:SigE family RNA polymerase sigma factor [Actinoplanes ianthinogenes]BCJ39629.1 RNA polymerase sigma24 factor [Actinoplanes ianthinogenes]GGR48455.1 RNA polymerase sigma24 factor [Actinoplanes ianthinogenes]
MLELLDPPGPAPCRAPATTEEFTRFASDSSPRLHSTAFQLCRDWHLAQDLTQTTLTKLFLSWERAAMSENLSAYAQKVLLRTYLDYRRRRSSTEATPGEMREPSYSVNRDLRIAMMDALGRLPARDRSIVLLRFFADHSVEQVAEELDVPVTVVKSQTRRSLIKLKHLLLRERSSLFAA